MPYLLLALNIALMATGQIFFKKSSIFMNENEAIPLLNRYLYNTWLYAGVFTFGIATLVWVKLLSLEKLSSIYPMQSIAYVVVAVLSFFIFKERLHPINMIGIMVIIFGVFLMTIKK